MPAPRRDRWVEWQNVARERAEAAREVLREWWVAVRAEPELFWQTVAVRYTTYAVGGLVVFWFARGAIDMVQPAGAIEASPLARTAHFDVICSNPRCGRHYIIERRFKFKRFPVACPHCQQNTGQRALRCTSKACRGKLAATIEVNGGLHCAVCSEPVGRRR